MIDISFTLIRFSRILDLQKDRYFEMLASKYWNQSLKAQCLNSDDNEGITLESLGELSLISPDRASKLKIYEIHFRNVEKFKPNKNGKRQIFRWSIYRDPVRTRPGDDHLSRRSILLPKTEYGGKIDEGKKKSEELEQQDNTKFNENEFANETSSYQSFLRKDQQSSSRVSHFRLPSQPPFQRMRVFKERKFKNGGIKKCYLVQRIVLYTRRGILI